MNPVNPPPQQNQPNQIPPAENRFVPSNNNNNNNNNRGGNIRGKSQRGRGNFHNHHLSGPPPQMVKKLSF